MVTTLQIKFGNAERTFSSLNQFVELFLYVYDDLICRPDLDDTDGYATNVMSSDPM